MCIVHTDENSVIPQITPNKTLKNPNISLIYCACLTALHATVTTILLFMLHSIPTFNIFCITSKYISDLALEKLKMYKTIVAWRRHAGYQNRNSTAKLDDSCTNTHLQQLLHVLTAN